MRNAEMQAVYRLAARLEFSEALRPRFKYGREYTWQAGRLVSKYRRSHGDQ